MTWTDYSVSRIFPWINARLKAAYARQDLWHHSLTSLAECADLFESCGEEMHKRQLLEQQLTDRLERLEESIFEGKCWVCSKKQAFLYDRNYSDGIHVNWRERLVCPRCGLNNRLRLCVQVIERMAPKRTAMYLTEQVTPLADFLSRRYAKLAKSEFLGDGHVPGSVDARGIRHEDVTALSFGGDSFDCVLSFDVLEHVPDYRTALAEFWRVLRVGGSLVLSVPFGLLTENNVIRARVGSDGSVEHLLTPEYHGDPVDPQGGILCYYHFGWELLEDLKTAGFGAARVDVYWSSEYGHLGDIQPVIIATK